MRRSTNREYAIRLTVPDSGEYYYTHENFLNKLEYVFTQKLSSVRKWKTIKFTEAKIVEISNKLLLNKGYISFSCVPRDNKSLIKMVLYGNYKSDLDNKKTMFIDNFTSIINDIKSDGKIDFENLKELVKHLKVFEKDRNDYFRTKDCKNILEIVDVSYNFRGLKLKKLHNIENEEV